MRSYSTLNFIRKPFCSPEARYQKLHCESVILKMKIRLFSNGRHFGQNYRIGTIFFRNVVHDGKCTIPYITFMYIKRPSHALVHKNSVCNTGGRLFQTRVRSFQLSSTSKCATFFPSSAENEYEFYDSYLKKLYILHSWI